MWLGANRCHCLVGEVLWLPQQERGVEALVEEPRQVRSWQVEHAMGRCQDCLILRLGIDFDRVQSRLKESRLKGFYAPQVDDGQAVVEW